MAPELTSEEIQAFSDVSEELSKKYHSPVHPVVFIEPDTFERTVAYLKEPDYIVKIRIMDKAATVGMYSANDELREMCMLREESNPITYGEGRESDKYKLGLTDYCIKFMKRAHNQFDKKK
jgi:hypothetical protein